MMFFRYSHAIHILLNHDNILRWICTYDNTVKILNLKHKFREAFIYIFHTDYFIARFRRYYLFEKLLEIKEII